MTFEYDPQKAQTNWRKHNVSFAEAEFVFYDPLAIHDIDPDAKDEERFIAVGMETQDYCWSLFIQCVVTQLD